MNNLNKFYEIWKDLDQSYVKLGDSLKVANRGEFLKKMCFDNKGNSIITRIKGLLANEMDTYSDSDLGKYSDLIESLDSISFLLETEVIEYDEIVSLNKLILLGVYEKKNATLEKKVTEESILKSYYFVNEPELLSSASMFSKYGEISSFSKKYRNKIVTCSLSEDFSLGFFAVSKEGRAQLESRLKTLRSGEFSKRVIGFLNKLIDALNNGSESLDVGTRLVYCDSSNLVDGKIFGRSVKSSGSGKYYYNDIKIIIL